MPGQNAGDIATFDDHLKIVLRSGKQRVHRLLERCVLRKRVEFAHHRARNRKTARNIFELGEGRFLRCTHVNKQGNEKEEWISKKAYETEDECAALADAGGDLRGTRITQSSGEECAQDPATIHWKCRQQIEKDEHNIDHE